jgi:hypothetical protein
VSGTAHGQPAYKTNTGNNQRIERMEKEKGGKNKSKNIRKEERKIRKKERI